MRSWSFPILVLFILRKWFAFLLSSSIFCVHHKLSAFNVVLAYFLLFSPERLDYVRINNSSSNTIGTSKKQEDLADVEELA